MRTHTDVVTWATDDAEFLMTVSGGEGEHVLSIRCGESVAAGNASLIFTNIGGAHPIANMRRLRDALSDHLFVHDPEGEAKPAAQGRWVVWSCELNMWHAAPGGYADILREAEVMPSDKAHRLQSFDDDFGDVAFQVPDEWASSLPIKT